MLISLDLTVKPFHDSPRLHATVSNTFFRGAMIARTFASACSPPLRTGVIETTAYIQSLLQLIVQ